MQVKRGVTLANLSAIFTSYFLAISALVYYDSNIAYLFQNDYYGLSEEEAASYSGTMLVYAQLIGMRKTCAQSLTLSSKTFSRHSV